MAPESEASATRSGTRSGSRIRPGATLACRPARATCSCTWGTSPTRARASTTPRRSSSRAPVLHATHDRHGAGVRLCHGWAPRLRGRRVALRCGATLAPRSACGSSADVSAQ
jgi:hypothetical protein